MSEEEDIRLAEAYCQNALDKTTREQVEDRAKSDPAFKQLLNDIKVLLAGIQDAGQHEVMKSMEQWEQSHPLKTRTSVIPMRTWMAVGIAAAVLLAVSIFFPKSTPEPKTVALFNSYYQPYPNVVMPTVRGTQEDSSGLARAYQAYESKEYEKAASEFADLNEKNAAVYFYMGQCYLALGETDHAITNFKQSLASEETFAAQAQWYLSLAYLKLGQMVLAKEALEKVVRQGNSYSPKAESILKQL